MHPVGVSCKFGVVGDQQDGVALAVDFGEQLHNHLTVVAVQIAGWLVGDDNLRFVDQRPGDSRPLGLAAGQLVGHEVFAVAHADQLQDVAGPLGSPDRRHAPVSQRQGDIFQDVQPRQEVIKLEDKADTITPQAGLLVRAQAGSRPAVQRDNCRASACPAGR